MKLFAVDRYSNESEPVTVTITPLEPAVTASLASLDIYAGFSSVVVTMENPQETPIDIYVTLKGNGSEALKVYTSNKAEERIFIQGLDAVPYEVSAYIKDNYGNCTESKSFGSITPLTDYKLDKKSFSFLRDQLLYGDRWDYTESSWEKQTPKEEWKELYTQDSMKNAKESRFEGHINKFWDDMTDDDPNYSLNYFHSGTSYPFSYFIDLGREVQISRMRLFMRNLNAWGTYTVKTCEIWISNDQTPRGRYSGRLGVRRHLHHQQTRERQRNGPRIQGGFGVLDLSREPDLHPSVPLSALQGGQGLEQRFGRLHVGDHSLRTGCKITIKTDYYEI